MRNDVVRILQLVNDMGRGGVETWLMHVFRNLDRSRFVMDFMVFTDRAWQYDDEIFSLGGKILTSAHPKNLRRFSHDLRTILRSCGPYSAVHSHSPMTDGPGLRVARQEGIPVRIIHSHNDWSRCFPQSLGTWLFFQWSMYEARRSATHGLAASGVAASTYFGSDWQNEPKWMIQFCGMDFKQFRDKVDRRTVREELGIPEEAFVIGNVAKIREQKNHLFMLEIIAEVAKSDPNVRFLIVGDGPFEGMIARRVAELGLDEYVLLLGSRPDVPKIMMGAMDLFLLPSSYEGLGLVLVEAQAAGLPCIFSDVVPMEANIVPPLINRMSLSQPAVEWARAILAIHRGGPNVTREEALGTVEKSRFNIFGGNLQMLQDIYAGKTAVPFDTAAIRTGQSEL